MNAELVIIVCIVLVATATSSQGSGMKKSGLKMPRLSFSNWMKSSRSKSEETSKDPNILRDKLEKMRSKLSKYEKSLKELENCSHYKSMLDTVAKGLKHSEQARQRRIDELTTKIAEYKKDLITSESPQIAQNWNEMIKNQEAELEKNKSDKDPIHIRYTKAKETYDNCSNRLATHEAMVKKVQEDIKKLELELQNLDNKRFSEKQ